MGAARRPANTEATTFASSPHRQNTVWQQAALAGREAPFRIALNHGGRKGLILLDQVRAVDKTKLAKKLGMVSAKTLSSTLRTLQEVFAE